MPSSIVRPVPWVYLGGDVITSPQNGYASTHVTTMPAGTTIIEMRANGGDTYFVINGGAFADLNQPGFIPDNGGEIIGPLAGLTRLDVFTMDGGAVHIMFFKQKEP